METLKDAANIGFDDSFIYDELDLKPADRKIPSMQKLAKPLKRSKFGMKKPIKSNIKGTETRLFRQSLNR